MDFRDGSDRTETGIKDFEQLRRCPAPTGQAAGQRIAFTPCDTISIAGKGNGLLDAQGVDQIPLMDVATGHAVIAARNRPQM